MCVSWCQCAATALNGLTDVHILLRNRECDFVILYKYCYIELVVLCANT